MDRAKQLLAELGPTLVFLALALAMLLGTSCAYLRKLDAGGWYRTRAVSEPCAAQGGEVYVTVAATGDVRWWCCVEAAGMCEALLSANVTRP